MPTRSPGLAPLGTPNTKESSEELEKQGGCLEAALKHGGLSLVSVTSITKVRSKNNSIFSFHISYL